jgi:ABC-type nitrate/sulfonate/bicarbonate transport system permease component
LEIKTIKKNKKNQITRIQRLKKNKLLERIIWIIISYTILLTGWYLLATFTGIGKFLPAPGSVIIDFITAFYEPIGTHTLLGHIGWSLSRAAVGFAIGSIFGISLGLVMGWYKIGEAIFKPFFEILRPVPPLAWIPISILWFGIGEESKYFIIFLAAFTAVTLNTYAGVQRTDPVLVGAAKMLGASNRQIFFHVALRSTVPAIFAGLQISLNAGLNGVLAAEMVRSSVGMGWLIIAGSRSFDMSQVFVGLMTIALVGYTLITTMRWIEMRLCRWSGVSE